MEEIALDLAKLSLCSQKMCNLSDDNEWTPNRIARFCEKEIGTNLIRRILLLLNAVVVVLHKYNFRIILFVCFVCHFLSS